MIYLIGGAPRSGKSILADRLSKLLNIPCVSTDDLEGTAREETPEEEWWAKFPKTVMRKETGYSNDEMYSKFTSEQIVKAYIQQSKAIWDEVEKLADSESCIIEGYHIHPALVNRLENKLGKENVRSIFLVRTDTKEAAEKAVQFASDGDWFVERTQNESTYPKIAEMIKEFSEFFKQEAGKYRLRVVSVDIQFEDKLSEALTYLSS